MNSLLISDAYKQNHRVMYPKGTNLVYSNWTPRSDKYAVTKNGVVVFGIQAFLKSITKDFKRYFFDLPREEAIGSFREGYETFFGTPADTSHVEALYDLGYLPISVKALPEGSICPIGVPMMTLVNTIDEFAWLTNYLETIMSTELWQPMTSATIAKGYRDLLKKWSDKTCDNDAHLPFQAHDFSMRGMSGLGSAMASGAGHLLSFVGTDTLPAVEYLKYWYNADPKNELVGTSIPATEHSVMSMSAEYFILNNDSPNELLTFKRLITETFPDGFISIVSDTFDLWKVCTEYLPELKEEILARDGKVVIRPDSGDPVDIICGLKNSGKLPEAIADKYILGTPTYRGVIEILWDIFGGTINSKGYKVLDPHIGAIYGDSITLGRADEICDRLEKKGFASSNIVLGVGSYTYQFNTRDTYGFAMKATYGEVNHIGREIFKDPITDNGLKKSLKGLIQVKWENGRYVAYDQVTWEQEKDSELKEVYRDGKLLIETSLSEIRNRLNG